jgi:hypothetical protein
MKGKNKNIFIIGLIIVILVCLVIYAYGDNIKSSVSINNKHTCSDKIIPKNITFDIYFNPYATNPKQGLVLSDNTKWADGSRVGVWITSPVFEYDEQKKEYKEVVSYKGILDMSTAGMNYEPVCVRGSQAGENINYFYCRNLAYYNSTTPISPSGEIGNTDIIQYKINLILKVINNTYGNNLPLEVIDATCNIKD